jgi:lysyl-tRNA synthetase class II
MALTAETKVTEEDKIAFKKNLKRISFADAIDEVLNERGGSMTMNELRLLTARGDQKIRQGCQELIKHKIAAWRDNGNVIILLD